MYNAYKRESWRGVRQERELESVSLRRVPAKKTEIWRKSVNLKELGPKKK